MEIRIEGWDRGLRIGIRDWGLGIWDLGLRIGIRDWGLGIYDLGLRIGIGEWDWESQSQSSILIPKS